MTKSLGFSSSMTNALVITFALRMHCFGAISELRPCIPRSVYLLLVIPVVLATHILFAFVLQPSLSTSASSLDKSGTSNKIILQVCGH